MMGDKTTISWPGQWEVLVKCDDDCGSGISPNIKGLVTDDDVCDSDIEISVIAKNNKHGHRSWGWPDTNKIILLDGSIQGKDDLDWTINVAKILCNALNRKEVIP
jgi:hypothetical protein